MREPTELETTPPAPDPQPRRMRPAAWAIIGAGGLIAVLLLGFFGLRLTGVLKPPIPTPACVEPILNLGAAKFKIESVAQAADGGLPATANVPGTAYWIEGTNVNYVFALSPASGGPALESAASPGAEARITWADCMTDTYTIETVRAGLPDAAALLDQTAGGVTAFVPGAGPLIKAARPKPAAVETIAPAEQTGVQADLALGEMVVSADGTAITMGVTITNTGVAAFTITPSDVSLILEDDSSVPPTAVEPALPLEIRSGVSATLEVTFPKPKGNAATLKILDLAAPYYF